MSKNEIDYKLCANYLSKRDPILEKLVRKHGIVTLPPKEDSFTKFVKIIVNQQLSNKAASTIFSRLESKLSKSNAISMKVLVKRGSSVESIHRAHACICDTKGRIYSSQTTSTFHGYLVA